MLSDVTADGPVWNYSILTAWWVTCKLRVCYECVLLKHDIILVSVCFLISRTNKSVLVITIISWNHELLGEEKIHWESERADKSKSYPLTIIPTEEILMRKYIYFLQPKIVPRWIQNYCKIMHKFECLLKKKLGKDYAYFHFLKWCQLICFQVNRYLQYS